METAMFKAGPFVFKAEFSDFGLRKLNFSRSRKPESKPLPKRWGLLKRELEEYLSGEREHFTVPLDLEDISDFDFRVYEQLLIVPYGETISYGELAKRAGRPKGARAIGQAVGRNPICIIIPCHRVIASNGGIGGYGGGLALKRKLLEIEGVDI
jgi:methylated-DNA-[protein]-cysteine S-methyltransferase